MACEVCSATRLVYPGLEFVCTQRTVMRRNRSYAIWVIASAAVAAALAVVWTMLGIRSGADQLFNRGPTLPTPSVTDAAATLLTPEGVKLTIKQRSHAWLPGGKLKLHLDDITGQQVLVSATDAAGRVVLAPHSVRQGDRFGVSNMEIVVVRLNNIVFGSGDFGEFEVRLKQ